MCALCSSVEWPPLSYWRLFLLPLDSLREHFVMTLDCHMMEDTVCDVTADQVLNNGTWVRVHSFIEWPPSSCWRLCLLPLDSVRDHLLWHWIVTWWNIWSVILTQARALVTEHGYMCTCYWRWTGWGAFSVTFGCHLTENIICDVSTGRFFHDRWVGSGGGGGIQCVLIFYFLFFFSFSPLNAGSHFYCKCCFCKTKLWKQPFSFMFPKLWTSLPCDNYRLFSLEIVITPEAHDPLVDRSTIYCCINPMKCLWWTVQYIVVLIPWSVCGGQEYSILLVLIPWSVCGGQEYNVPTSKDIPIDWRVHLLPDAPNPVGVNSSKGTHTQTEVCVCVSVCACIHVCACAYV